MGPKLSLNGLSKEAIAALPNAAELGSQYAQTIEVMRSSLMDVGTSTNVLTLLSMRILGLPSLTGSFAPKAGLGAAQRVIEIPTWLALVGLIALLTVCSLLVGCFCLSFIAQEARDEEMAIAYALQVAWRSWVRLTVLLLVAVLAVAIVVGGIGVMGGLLAVLSPELAWLTLNVFTFGFLSLAAYGAIVLFFTSRAIVMDDMGILHSVWSGLNVLHRNFLPAIGFILIVNVLQTGLLYIWRMLAVSVFGTLVGILGNAYVSTGLVMASLIFYRDRFVAWQETRSGEGQP
jgi:hypothetical protein